MRWVNKWKTTRNSVALRILVEMREWCYSTATRFFFYGKGQGKQAFGSPDGKWLPPPTTPCSTRGATGTLLADKVEIDALFEDTPVISTGNTAAGMPFRRSVARGRKFLRNSTVVDCHVSRWCGWYFSLWRTVRLENSVAGNRSNSSLEHSPW